jgi:hypothetical protein
MIVHGLPNAAQSVCLNPWGQIFGANEFPLSTGEIPEDVVIGEPVKGL